MKVQKKRNTQRKVYKKKNSGVLRYNHEIIGILLFSFGVLISFSFYLNKSVGVFGEFTKDFLLGLMGIPSIILPPIIIVYSVFLLFKRTDKNVNLRMIYILVLLLIVSAMIQTGYYNSKNYEGMTFLNSIYRLYKDGVSINGGGILGGLISIPFIMMFQVLGTIVILTTLAVITIILLTGISVADIFISFKDFCAQKIEDIKFKISFHKEEKEEALRDTDENKVEIQMNAGGNVIKFNAGHAIDSNIDTAQDNSEENIQSEPVELIMKDLKKTSAKDKEDIKGTIEDIMIEHGHSNVEYKFPPFDLLNMSNQNNYNVDGIKNTALDGAKKLEDTLKSFGVEARVINISIGPAVTRYELQPSPGVKVSRIVGLSDDISLNFAASGVRIEAPIPGKAAVGIEVPNKQVTPVMLREVMETSEFIHYPSKLAFAAGKDISGENIIADIEKMPHILVAGATGSGKSVCINSLIISLLYKSSPDEVKLLMIDPKVVELGIYNGIPHLLIPVVTDPRKAAGALNWAVQEMVNRYKLFAEKGVRDLKGYNAAVKENGEDCLPHVVIIIDELADLMMVAPNDVEDAICRLAQMARAAGMHLVIATQRPSVDVITGVIKANIPSRIAFSVSSQVDSRTILDMAGAEKLLGKGDMLFYPIGEPKPIRIKGAFVSDKEVEKVVEFIKAQGDTEYNNSIIDEINSENQPEDGNPGDNDQLLPQAIELVVEAGQASVSLIQRKFKVGYARAARIVDQMEARGIVGRFEGSKPRQVLITRQQWQEMQISGNLN